MISVPNIAKRMQGLLKDIQLEIEVKTERFWADPAFIEQVLLNIIKNADEASAPGAKIKLIIRKKQ